MVEVKRIVPNFELEDPERAKAFYRDMLGLDIAMDMGWIVTFSANASGPLQISIASEGGAGTPVPDVSIEVDDSDTVYEKAVALGLEIVRPITDEEWGVRRFFVRDPCGRIVNILTHI